MRKPQRPAVQTRLETPLNDEFENWRRAQPIIPPRSDALRELLKKGLAADSAERRPTKQTA